MMDSDLAYVLLTEQQLHDREEELGRILTEEYADKRPIFLGILRGVVVFYADMVRRIPIPCDFDFMSVSSYEGSESTGRVKVQLDTRYDIRGRHVVILEDILDTGRTLHAVVQMLQLRQPASLKICALLDAGWPISLPTGPAFRFPTSSWSAMVWTTMTSTAIFPMSAC